jgi:hypothetical protein
MVGDVWLEMYGWKCMVPVADRHVRNLGRTPDLTGSTGWKMKLPLQTIENGPRVYSSKKRHVSDVIRQPGIPGIHTNKGPSVLVC